MNLTKANRNYSYIYTCIYVSGSYTDKNIYIAITIITHLRRKPEQISCPS